MAGDYELNLYQGNQSFDPSGKIPHHLGKDLVSAGQMGITVNPMVANQLGELSKSLNQGVVPVEVGSLDMKNFDTIPKEHWEEMRRKAQLAESKLSLHAPLVDPAGINEQGRWDESTQQLAEHQLKQVIDKASILTDKNNKEPVPVTIHASNYAGSSYEIRDGEKVASQYIAINRSTGELVPLKRDSQYSPILEDGKVVRQEITPEEQLLSANNTQWRDDLRKIEFERSSAEKVLDSVSNIDRAQYINYSMGQVREGISEQEYDQIRRVHTAAQHIEQAEIKVRGLFDKAYNLAKEDGDENQIKILNKAAEDYGKTLRADAKTPEDIYYARDPKNRSNALFELESRLQRVQPKLFEKIEDFASKKAAETLSNVALHAYEKYKDDSPIVSVENLYEGMAFSQGKDMANMIETTRKKFVEKATEKGISESKAKKIAEDKIGITFDVGHLNISRKKGFTEDDLVKEAKEMSKYVKHVHLTDNFGNMDTHLPVGMGNVPVEKMLKALGKNAKDARKINEVGGYINAFGETGFKESLQAAGSPIYSSSSGPYWAETTGFQESYSSGFGQMLPQTHYESFGAGFSRLPVELGGSVASGPGRMGGGY